MGELPSCSGVTSSKGVLVPWGSGGRWLQSTSGMEKGGRLALLCNSSIDRENPAFPLFSRHLSGGDQPGKRTP